MADYILIERGFFVTCQGTLEDAVGLLEQKWLAMMPHVSFRSS